jgi:glycerate 2-kinase
MSLNVVIAPDKFKGTMDAATAAEAIARGWRKARPKDQFTLLPMSDGGDGFGQVISALLRAKPQIVRTIDAAHRPCAATWWWESKAKTAVIESAKVIGLAMLPPGKFHPFQLDTAGLGKVLLAARNKGAKHIIIGIGGSATNDGGFGLARALGWEFLDANAKPIRRWTDLHNLAGIRPLGTPSTVSARWASDTRPDSRRDGARRSNSLASVEIIVAVDVQNPLLGMRGATRVYGPQKGLSSSDFQMAESCLRRLAQVCCSGGLRPPHSSRRSQSAATLPGLGAAGGLGFGLLAFAGARLQPGFDLFAEMSKLSERLRTADVVITGEGAIDRSTLMGKGAGELARRCRALGIPCIGLAGMVVRSRELSRLFTRVHALTDLTSPEHAKTKSAFWLEQLAKHAASALESNR